MKLKRHCDYMADFPDGTRRRVEFRGFSAKGICKITDYDGAGSPYKTIARFRLHALPEKSKQQELAI